MRMPGRTAVVRIALEVVGWLLVVAGVAALVLPGPGLLMLFAGLALLSRQYAWARRYVEPVRLRALRGAADGVETWPRIALSVLGALAIGACGVLWIVHPHEPTWWPVRATLWLLGGAWTGVTLLGSCAIALGVIGYAFVRFRGHPEALAGLEESIEEADEQRHEHV